MAAAKPKPAASPYPALPLLKGDEAVSIANACRAAMKGFGTDEKALIAQLCHLNSAQAAQVVDAYTTSVRRDLEKDIHSETSGDFRNVLVYGLLGPAQIDARLVRTAYKGLGTDELGLVEVICTRTDFELQEAAKAFKREFDALLRDEVLSDCSGDFKRLMEAVLTTAEKQGRALPPLTQVEDDVIRLYKAGEGKIGTNESVFIEIFGTNHRAYLEKVAEAYAKKHGKSLVSVIRSEFSGYMAEALVALVQPVDEFLAARLYGAMKGVGTNEKVVVRIIMAERDRHLPAIAATFLKKYERSLSYWVEREFSSHTRDALMAVLKARNL